MAKETGIENINEAIKKAINEALLEAQEKYEFKKMIENVVLSMLHEDAESNRNQYLNDRRKRVQQDQDSGKMNNLRNFVIDTLRSGKVKMADAMRSLWKVKKGSKDDDVYRSLFSKCVSGEPDADGAVRKFTDDEITRLAQYLHGIAS